jgi:hypothetical protein
VSEVLSASKTKNELTKLTLIGRGELFELQACRSWGIS